ncbi:MAG: hypothetical protein IKJ32_06195 [Clostridia bacterium]|nr:hypothetical protein [Clostridia bacterium]
MEGNYLNYQFSIFGDFSDITPNDSKNVIELLKLYEDMNFIPSIFQEIPLGGLPSKLTNRIMLSNSDGWSMNIGNVRIDLSISKNEKSKFKDMNIDEILVEVKEIFKRFLNLYNKKCNRIAFNTLFLFELQQSQQIDDKHAEKGNLIQFYNENKIEEWNEKYISQVEEQSLDNEIINIGTLLNKSSGEILLGNKGITFENNIVLQFDINTTPRISTHRFDDVKVNMFFDIAKSYKNILETHIQGIIDNE